MTQPLPEPKTVQLALREIAEAREHLRLASDVLSAIGASEATQAMPLSAVARKARQLEIETLPQGLLDIAHEVIRQVLPEQLAQRALQAGASPRDWLYRVYTVSGVPRGISEAVATMVVMLAAVKFGLRHQLLLQTETRLVVGKRDILGDQISPFLEQDGAAVGFAARSRQRQISDCQFSAVNNNDLIRIGAADGVAIPVDRDRTDNRRERLGQRDVGPQRDAAAAVGRVDFRISCRNTHRPAQDAQAISQARFPQKGADASDQFRLLLTISTPLTFCACQVSSHAIKPSSDWIFSVAVVACSPTLSAAQSTHR